MDLPLDVYEQITPLILPLLLVLGERLAKRTFKAIDMALCGSIRPVKPQSCEHSFTILLETISEIVPNTISTFACLVQLGSEFVGLSLPDDLSKLSGELDSRR